MDLASFNNYWFRPGRNRLWVILWILVGQPLFGAYWLPLSRFKRVILRLFGARIGKGVVIKPGVRVKYPWRLSIGDHSWIGESAWIDNLEEVKIGANVCISQGAYLCTGSHDASKKDFPLVLAPIVLEDQTWVCAKATILQGVTMRQGAVLSAASLAQKGEFKAWTFFGGVPAKEISSRVEAESKSDPEA